MHAHSRTMTLTHIPTATHQYSLLTSTRTSSLYYIPATTHIHILADLKFLYLTFVCIHPNRYSLRFPYTWMLCHSLLRNELEVSVSQCTRKLMWSHPTRNVTVANFLTRGLAHCDFGYPFLHPCLLFSSSTEGGERVRSAWENTAKESNCCFDKDRCACRNVDHSDISCSKSSRCFTFPL